MRPLLKFIINNSIRASSSSSSSSSTLLCSSLHPLRIRKHLHLQRSYHSIMTNTKPSSINRIKMINQHLTTHHHPSRLQQIRSNQTSQPSPLVLTQTDANLRTLTLNRPQALNALNQEMLEGIGPNLVKWEGSDEAKLIILKGNGRAFCAGGDVVSVTNACNSKDQEQRKKAAEFFKVEYEVDSFIAKMSTPVVSILNGITMGGGLGLTMHTPFRIATENTRLAMPETSIGLFPDVGATFFLPRLDGEIGTYLGLTGTNLYGWGAYQAGIASHFVPSSSLQALEDRLAALSPNATHDRINSTINEFSADSIEAISSGPKYDLIGIKREAIDLCFGQNTLEEIIQKLETIENGILFSSNQEHEDQDLKDWARSTKETLLKQSPTSLKLTLMALREGKKLMIDECFTMEMRLAATCCDIESHTDFVTGVKHLLIDKNKSSPKWNPETIEKVDLKNIQRLFFSSKAPSSTHLPRIEFKPTKIKSFNSYLYPIEYSLPTEEYLKQSVIGNLKDSGNFSLTRSELINSIRSRWIDKVGVIEKVDEILNRKTNLKHQTRREHAQGFRGKDDLVLQWEY